MSVVRASGSNNVFYKKQKIELKNQTKSISYRLSQMIGFLLGARIFVVLVLAFALYVSTFFLFNQEESLRSFVFDFKVHGIIFCTLLSLVAGGIINQFYDREKDKITKPFRTKIQSFLKQKYFLYAYLSLNLVSLGISWAISFRVFIYLVVYQFVMWFYSHKISKVLILNNFTFVALSLYPFFGMLIYYKTFSVKILLMAIFLFLILLIIDILKDTLTKKADKIFGYTTIPNFFGNKISKITLIVLQVILYLISMILVEIKGLHSIMAYYFSAGIFVIIFSIYLVLGNSRNFNFLTLNLLRMWVFIGIVSMLMDGIFTKF